MVARATWLGPPSMKDLLAGERVASASPGIVRRAAPARLSQWFAGGFEAGDAGRAAGDDLAEVIEIGDPRGDGTPGDDGPHPVAQPRARGGRRAAGGERAIAESLGSSFGSACHFGLHQRTPVALRRRVLRKPMINREKTS